MSLRASLSATGHAVYHATLTQAKHVASVDGPLFRNSEDNNRLKSMQAIRDLIVESFDSALASRLRSPSSRAATTTLDGNTNTTAKRHHRIANSAADRRR